MSARVRVFARRNPKPMVATDDIDSRILVLAPTGRDGGLAVQVLQREGIAACAASDLADLRVRMQEGVGALLIAEEALMYGDAERFVGQLRVQPAWSDIPVVLMTSGGEFTVQLQRLTELFSTTGNMSLLERPFRVLTLVSVIKTALRARRRQYQVRDLLRAQVQAMNQREEFISIAGHELKTPLTSLKLQLQISQHSIEQQEFEALAPARVAKLIASANRQVDRLARLVEDMLDVSRIQAGKLVIDKRATDLAEVAQEVVERFEPQFAMQKSQIRFLGPASVHGQWDPFRIDQLISNLVANALRYAAASPVEVTLACADAHASISVKDRGPGIATADQARIFERFERAVASTEISGLGLGLYICREVARAHDGDILVVSAPGQGAEFIVNLPR